MRLHPSPAAFSFAVPRASELETAASHPRIAGLSGPIMMHCVSLCVGGRGVVGHCIIVGLGL